MADSKIAEAARTNNEATFISMYYSSMAKIITERYRMNDGFFQVILDNPEVYDMVKKDVLRKVYRECRSLME